MAEVSWGLYTADELPGCRGVHFQGDVDVGEGIGDAAAHRGWLAPQHRNHALGAVGVVPGCVRGKSHLWVMARPQDIHWLSFLGSLARPGAWAPPGLI